MGDAADSASAQASAARVRNFLIKSLLLWFGNGKGVRARLLAGRAHREVCEGLVRGRRGARRLCNRADSETEEGETAGRSGCHCIPCRGSLQVFFRGFGKRRKPGVRAGAFGLSLTTAGWSRCCGA